MIWFYCHEVGVNKTLDLRFNYCGRKWLWINYLKIEIVIFGRYAPVFSWIRTDTSTLQITSFSNLGVHFAIHSFGEFEKLRY